MTEELSVSEKLKILKYYEQREHFYDLFGIVWATCAVLCFNTHHYVMFTLSVIISIIMIYRSARTSLQADIWRDYLPELKRK